MANELCVRCDAELSHKNGSLMDGYLLLTPHTCGKTENRDFAAEVKAEIAKARSKFGPVHSLHEGYGILCEELDEFFEQVKAWPKRWSRAETRKELVQIAAMCQRIAEDCDITNECA